MQKTLWVILIFILAFTANANPNALKKVTKDGKEYYIYQVEKSEGFFSISNKFNITQDEIIAANPTTKDGLRVGQEILIPIKKNAPTDKNTTIHTVAAGETVFSLSQKFGVTVEDIYRWNPETREVLRIGSTIQILHNEPSVTNKTTSNVKETKPVETHTKAADKKPEQKNEAVNNQPIESSITNKTDVKDLYIEHTVRRRETLFSIAALYDVTVDEILKANPSAADGLKVRSTLLIPQSKQIEKAQTLAEKAFATEEVKTTVIEKPSKTVSKPIKNTVKIAILLPFEIDAQVRDAGMDRFVEFYQGVLIAADTLKKNGLSIDITVMDIGKTAGQLNNVLANPALKEVDIIFGPAYTSQIAPVANFAKNNQIKLIVPFSPSVAEVANNEFVYQIITPQSDLSTTIAKEFTEVFADKLLYILQPRNESFQDKKDVVNQLKSSMNKKGVPYRTMFLGDVTASRLDSIANSTQKEIVLLTPSTNLVVVTQLSNLIQQVQSRNIRVLSFSEWHQLQMQDLYRLPHYTYTNHHIDFKNEQIMNFFSTLRSEYGISGTQSVPNYALLGYDLAMYFFPLLQQYGTNIEPYLQQPRNGLLQMNLRFEKVNPNGGYQNRGIFIQTYNQNGIVPIK